jgi:hypothetical protein
MTDEEAQELFNAIRIETRGKHFNKDFILGYEPVTPGVLPEPSSPAGVIMTTDCYKSCIELLRYIEKHEPALYWGWPGR